jgi:hypothetical protein
MRNVYPLLYLVLATFPRVALAQNQNLLELAKTALTQARQNIHSVRATIKISTRVRGGDSANLISRTCQWVQSGNSLRWELTETSPHSQPLQFKRGEKHPEYVRTDVVTLNVQQDGQRTTMRKEQQNGKTIRQAAFVTSPTDAMDEDLWSAAGFNVLDDPRTSLTDILETGADHTRLLWSSLQGRKTLHIHHTMPNRTIDAYLSPEYGYLAQRMLSTVIGQGKQEFCFLREVQAFTNYGAGVFFPSKVITTYYRGDADISNYIVQSTFHFNDVVINQPIDPGLFRLEIPVGTMVVDKVKGINYVMGRGGQPDPSRPVLPMVPGGDQISPVTRGQKRTKWILLWSPLFVGGGILASIMFRRHKKRQRLLGA